MDTNIVYPTLKTSKDVIFSFLLLTGYLKATPKEITLDGEYVYELIIPNKEVLYAYKKEILSTIGVTIEPSLNTIIANMI